MNKKYIFIIALVLLICISCSKDNDKTKAVQESEIIKRALDSDVIDRVAKIAAMFDINEEKAITMLDNEKITADEYKKIIAKIALDEKATNTFVDKKEIYKKQFQK